MGRKTVVKKASYSSGHETSKPAVRKEYVLCPPYGYSTYSPWFEDWFQEIYKKIINNTVVKEDRCYMIHKFVKHCLHLRGDLAECGVYKGGTAYLIAYTIKHSSANDKRMHLFDTFTGMPDNAVKKRDSHKEGDFGDVSLDSVKHYLSEFPNVKYYPGVIPKTFKSVQDKRFSFVHIDVDIYPTARDCCQFFYNRIVTGGIMIFDDYGFPGYKLAEKLAVDEFFSDKPESPISLRTGQCIVIKL